MAAMLRVERLLVWVVALAACSAPAQVAPDGVRVVSLHDVTTELAVALGVGERLVGVAEPVDVPGDVAGAIARVPRVGDLESIIAVRPTIVVGLAVVAARDPELVARLRERGVAVYLGDPATLDDVFALTREVAARVGAGGAGAELAARLAMQVRDGERGWSAAARPAGRVRVFVYDCCDPPFTTGGKTVLNDLIRRAGGDNVFGDLAAGWTHVSWEQVVARRPQLVVIHAYRYDGQGDVADKQRALRAIAALAALPTVVLPLGDSLGGLRSVDGLARLRSAIGPLSIEERS
jgi:iron complex transport system substrate-binding protein